MGPSLHHKTTLRRNANISVLVKADAPGVFRPFLWLACQDSCKNVQVTSEMTSFDFCRCKVTPPYSAQGLPYNVQIRELRSSGLTWQVGWHMLDGFQGGVHISILHGFMFFLTRGGHFLHSPPEGVHVLCSHQGGHVLYSSQGHVLQTLIKEEDVAPSVPALLLILYNAVVLTLVVGGEAGLPG